MRVLLRLAVPVVLAQVGTMTLGMVDMIMVGHLGRDALAAVAQGDVWVFGTLIFGIGLLMGLDPIITQAHGAGDGARCGRALQRGLVLAALVSIPISALWLGTEAALGMLGQAPQIAAQAQQYVAPQIWSVAPFLAFVALRQYLQGRGLMGAPLVVIAVANVVNAVLNWALIFGHLGLPALGIQGAGIATGLTRTFLFVGLVAITLHLRLQRGAWGSWRFDTFTPRGLWDVLRHGLPVALQFGLEVWAFSAAALLAGHLAPAELSVAVHVVAIRLASFSFMFPFGLSAATATRVGNLVGAGRWDQACRAAWTALGLGCLTMLVFAALFVLLRHQLPRIFTNDPGVIALAATILPIAGAFQLFDGAQAVAGGALRGFGRTLPAAAANLLGFYGLGLPLAYWLAFPHGGWSPLPALHVSGLWWALCAGLAAVALLLLLVLPRSSGVDRPAAR